MHLERRIRSASSFSVALRPTRRARASGSISRHGAAVADHSHEELSEAVVQFLDVGQHAEPSTATLKHRLRDESDGHVYGLEAHTVPMTYALDHASMGRSMKLVG
jgi:hypothetical protein